MSNQRGQVTKATSLMIVLNFLAKITGFLRETMLAKYYGATIATDAYLVAVSVPNFFNGVTGSALGTAIVPAYTEVEGVYGKEEAAKVASIMINVSALSLTFITLVGKILGPVLVGMIAPGFPPEVIDLATGLSDIVMFMLVFSCLGLLISGILNANMSFGMPSFAPVVTNIVIILATIFGSEKFGIEGVAYGTLFGWFALMLVQIPALMKTGFKYHFSFDLRHPSVVKTIKLSLPLMAGMGVYQIYFLIDRFFASALPEGSIASLNYSQKLMQLVLAVFVTAIASAVFPILARQKVAGAPDQFRRTLNKALAMIALVAIPATAAFFVMGTEIVTLLFKRGAFDQRAVGMTAFSLQFFALGLLAHSWNQILLRAFTSYNDTVSAVKYAGITVAINVLLSYLFRPWLGHGGLALANSLSAFINSFLLLRTMAAHTGGLVSRQQVTNWIRMILAACLMATALKLFLFLWVGKGSLLLEMTIGIGLGMGVYALGLYLFKVEEFRYFTEIAGQLFLRGFSKARMLGGKEVG